MYTGTFQMIMEVQDFIYHIHDVLLIYDEKKIS